MFRIIIQNFISVTCVCMHAYKPAKAQKATCLLLIAEARFQFLEFPCGIFVGKTYFAEHFGSPCILGSQQYSIFINHQELVHWTI
jgi:hypothetical protein